MFQYSRDSSNYSIEQIVNDKIIDGVLHYQVKWKGYQQKTWEPQQHLKNAPDHLNLWKEKKKKILKNLGGSNKKKQKADQQFICSNVKKKGKKQEVLQEIQRLKSGHKHSPHPKSQDKRKYPLRGGDKSINKVQQDKQSVHSDETSVSKFKRKKQKNKKTGNSINKIFQMIKEVSSKKDKQQKVNESQNVFTKSQLNSKSKQISFQRSSLDNSQNKISLQKPEALQPLQKSQNNNNQFQQFQKQFKLQKKNQCQTPYNIKQQKFIRQINNSAAIPTYNHKKQKPNKKHIRKQKPRQFQNSCGEPLLNHNQSDKNMLQKRHPIRNQRHNKNNDNKQTSANSPDWLIKQFYEGKKRNQEWEKHALSALKKLQQQKDKNKKNQIIQQIAKQYQFTNRSKQHANYLKTQQIKDPFTPSNIQKKDKKHNNLKQNISQTQGTKSNIYSTDIRKLLNDMKNSNKQINKNKISNNLKSTTQSLNLIDSTSSTLQEEKSSQKCSDLVYSQNKLDHNINRNNTVQNPHQKCNENKNAKPIQQKIIQIQSDSQNLSSLSSSIQQIQQIEFIQKPPHKKIFLNQQFNNRIVSVNNRQKVTNNNQRKPVQLLKIIDQHQAKNVNQEQEPQFRIKYFAPQQQQQQPTYFKNRKEQKLPNITLHESRIKIFKQSIEIQNLLLNNVDKKWWNIDISKYFDEIYCRSKEKKGKNASEKEKSKEKQEKNNQIKEVVNEVEEKIQQQIKNTIKQIKESPDIIYNKQNSVNSNIDLIHKNNNPAIPSKVKCTIKQQNIIQKHCNLFQIKELKDNDGPKQISSVQKNNHKQNQQTKLNQFQAQSKASKHQKYDAQYNDQQEDSWDLQFPFSEDNILQTYSQSIMLQKINYSYFKQESSTKSTSSKIKDEGILPSQFNYRSNITNPNIFIPNNINNLKNSVPNNNRKDNLKYISKNISKQIQNNLSNKKYTVQNENKTKNQKNLVKTSKSYNRCQDHYPIQKRQSQQQNAYQSRKSPKIINDEQILRIMSDFKWKGETCYKLLLLNGELVNIRQTTAKQSLPAKMLVEYYTEKQKNVR